MNQIKEKQNTQSVILWELDKRIIKEYAREKGLNFSAALRMIVREWYGKQTQDYKRENPNR